MQEILIEQDSTSDIQLRPDNCSVQEQIDMLREINSNMLKHVQAISRYERISRIQSVNHRLSKK